MVRGGHGQSIAWLPWPRIERQGEAREEEGEEGGERREKCERFIIGINIVVQKNKIK